MVDPSIPMVDPIPMVDLTPMVDSILIVDPVSLTPLFNLAYKLNSTCQHCRAN